METLKKRAHGEGFLEKLVHQLPGAVYQYLQCPDGTTSFPFISDGVMHIFEAEPEMIRKDKEAALSRIHPEDRKRIREANRAGGRNIHKIWEDEYRVLLPLRGERWIRETARPEVLGDGSVLWHGYLMDVTVRKRMEEALQRSEERYRLLSENSPIVVFQWHLSATDVFSVPFMGEKVREILGVTSQDVQADHRMIHNLIHPDDREDFEVAIGESAASLQKIHKVIRMYREGSRSAHRWIEVRANPEKQWDGSVLWTGAFVDVTEMKKTERKMSLEKERFHATLLSIGEGVIAIDHRGNVTVMNPAAEKMTGWSQNEALGRPLDDVFVISDATARTSLLNDILDVMEHGFRLDYQDALLFTRDGREIPIESTVSSIRDKNSFLTGVVIVFRDCTDKKENEKMIAFLSFHDQLTGLYNRRFYDEELRRLDTERNLPLSLLLVDVNGMKLVNDAFGHMEGDKLLLEVANCLRTGCRADDIVCRTGGDEFIIILPKVEPGDIEKVVGRIEKCFADSKACMIPVSAAFGWATKTRAKENMEMVYKDAEDMMYSNKILSRMSKRKEAVDRILELLFTRVGQEREHCQRVANLCRLIGEAMGLEHSVVENLYRAGLFHDIGKVTVDKEAFFSPGELTEVQWLEMRRHPEVSASILETVNDYAGFSEWVMDHHERWDGKGYPKGLRGAEIPQESRILAIADAYSSMTENRPYRKAKTEEEAIAILKEESGKQFDEEIVRTLLEKKVLQNRI